MNYDTKVNTKHLHDFLALDEHDRRIANDMDNGTYFAILKDWAMHTDYTSTLSNNEQTILVLILIEVITFPAENVSTVEEDFYFTFPQSSSLCNGYMIVHATSMQEARAKMIAEYGKIIFAFSYTRFDFIPQIAKYNLYEIPFGYMPEE
jgi:hypothetical protein